MFIHEAFRRVDLSRIRLSQIELFRNPEQEEINRLASVFASNMKGILDGSDNRKCELDKKQSEPYADIGRSLPVTINPERIKGGWQMRIINSGGIGELFGLKGNSPFLYEVWDEAKIERLSFKSSQEAKIAALKRWIGYATTAEPLFKSTA